MPLMPGRKMPWCPWQRCANYCPLCGMCIQCLEGMCTILCAEVVAEVGTLPASLSYILTEHPGKQKIHS